MGWGTIYRRRMRVFTLAIVIYLDYKALQHREKWISKSKRDALWQKAHERNARRVLQAMIELEGLWVKLGQYLSTRADVLPNAYITLLKQLQDSLPPRTLQEVFGDCLGSIGLANARAESKLVGTYETTEMIFMAGGNTKKDLMLKEVCHTIERELGKSMDGLFLEFDEVPLATASIAQVHRATLTNGQEVVVKVQHDGIKTIILEDLKNAKSIVDWIAWAEPQYNFNPMIDEWCKEAPKELDFNNEAENTRTVSRNLGCRIKDTNDNPNKVDVLIPEVIQSTEKVLVLEYMDGIRLNDLASLEACGVDKQKIVEEITRAYAHQIYVDGFFNGDPHPGNFLVSKQPPHFPVLLDFGLTKKLSIPMKQALAKMFLASVEGDHVALLSAFAEMGLKLRLDIPEQAMEVTSVFFRSSSPASEALENVKTLSEQRTKNMKLIQEKMRLSQKEVKRFNPVDAFPGDIVIFSRVLNLLRGLSSTMNVRIVYQEIMRPFAELALQGNIYKEPSVNAQWIYDTPVHCDVEAKLRQLLVELGNDDRILGIQVCAYKDGEVIIDTSAGILGRYDPRPVQPDSLFPVFSVTKGITAGMLHWLVDRGKLQLSENVANIWPEFGKNGKHPIKVHHVLNHTSGLQNALANLRGENALLLADWDECLNQIAMSIPENEPGREQLYHYLSFGWLCGGIIEKASGKKFQEVLEEAIVHPLKIEGELYVGIPPGVESRLAALTLDTNDLSKLSEISKRPDLPSTFQPENISEMVTALPVLFNMLNIRRAIIPAANGHCSARALARYYAALVDGGVVPPPHSSSFKPLLGSHPHIPKFPSAGRIKKGKGRQHNEIVTTPKKKANGYEQIKGDDNDTKRICDSHTRLVDDGSGGSSYASMPYSSGDDSCSNNADRIFSNLNIHDEFLGVGEYGNLAMANGKFGLGFTRYRSKDGSFTGFGHSGMGGSTGFCDIKNRFAIAVTLNKMSFGTVTRKIIQLVCSELNIPLPEEFSAFDDMRGDVELDISRPLIN